MKIWILSDLHLEFGGLPPDSVDCDVVVIAGDAGTKRLGIAWALSLPASTPVVYVFGNHEYYGAKIPNQLEKLRATVSGSHVYLLENESIVLGGWRFLGTTLWTDFALLGDRMRSSVVAMEGLTDFRKIRVAPRYSRLHPNDTVKMHFRALAWLKRELDDETRTVVVSHHAPSPLSLKPEALHDPISAAYASDLSEWIVEKGPELWIHGHVHRAVDYRIGATRIVSNPRGYPGERVEGYDPERIIELRK